MWIQDAQFKIHLNLTKSRPSGMTLAYVSVGESAVSRWGDREETELFKRLKLYIVLLNAIEWSDQEELTGSDLKCDEMTEQNVHKSVELHTVVTAWKGRSVGGGLMQLYTDS